MKNTAIDTKKWAAIGEYVAFFALIALTSILLITGCDEGMQIAKPVFNAEGKPFRICEVEPGDSSDLIEPGSTDNPKDFIGIVIVRELTETGAIVRPLPGVTCTIVSGPRSGESVVTNQHGHYLFTNIEGDDLHLRADKACFESKEVIVSRTRPTTLQNGLVFSGRSRRNKPGDILLGHEWPDLVRETLKQVIVVTDLVYYQIPDSSDAIWGNGIYNSDNGIIYIIVGPTQSFMRVIDTLFHEISHAHQHAMVSVDGSGAIGDWMNTPEGIAFTEARQRDWKTYGKLHYDSDRSHFSSLIENAAETMAYYLFIKHGLEPHKSHWNLETKAPNRIKWAEEWLNKKYD